MPNLPEKTTQCEDTDAGYCARHGCWKNPHQWRLCQTREDYFAKWDRRGARWKESDDYAKPGTLDAALVPSGIEIAVGIVAIEGGETLEKSIRSVVADGFTPSVFAASGIAERSHFSTVAVDRAQTPSTRWKVWAKAIDTLAASHPSAGAYAVISESLTARRGVRDFLLYDLWPAEDCGAVALVTGRDDAARVGVPTSIEVALCDGFLMSQTGIKAVRLHGQFRSNREQIPGTFIAEAVAKAGLSLWGYLPDLCEVSQLASIGYDPQDRFDIVKGQPGNVRRRKV